MFYIEFTCCSCISSILTSSVLATIAGYLLVGLVNADEWNRAQTTCCRRSWLCCFVPLQSAIVLFTYVQKNGAKVSNHLRCESTLRLITCQGRSWGNRMDPKLRLCCTWSPEIMAKVAKWQPVFGISTRSTPSQVASKASWPVHWGETW